MYGIVIRDAYMSKLERAHWELLAALQHHKTLSAAAQAVYITQAAASQRLKEAERRLGIQLVDRRGKSLQLNPSGQRLAEMGARMAQQLKHAESDAIWLGQRTRERWRLVQNHHDSPSLFLLFHQLCESALRYDAELVRSGQHAPLQMITSGDGDCALLPQTTESPGLTTLPVLVDDLVAAVPADSPLAAKTRLMPEDFREHDYLTYALTPAAGWEYERFFRFSGEQPSKLVKIESTHHILTMVSQGLGLSILPRLTCQLATDSLNFKMVALAVEPIQFQWNLHLSSVFTEVQQQVLSDALIVALRRISATSGVLK